MKDEEPKRKYVVAARIGRSEIEAAMASGDDQVMTDALFSAAHYDPDWRWAQDLCLHWLENGNDNMKYAAIGALGTLARIHRTIDRERVLAALSVAGADKSLEGRIDEALSDIRQFASR